MSKLPRFLWQSLENLVTIFILILFLQSLLVATFRIFRFRIVCTLFFTFIYLFAAYSYRFYYYLLFYSYLYSYQQIPYVSLPFIIDRYLWLFYLDCITYYSCIETYRVLYFLYKINKNIYFCKKIILRCSSIIYSHPLSILIQLRWYEYYYPGSQKPFKANYQPRLDDSLSTSFGSL